jgi:ABC-type lipoprotein release transport system permease subunit
MIYGGLRAVAGLALGLALAVALSQTVGSQLADVEPFDLPVFAGVSLLLLAAAQLAAFVPAWRASRVNPLETVRAE